MILLALLESVDERIALAAAQEVLNRGYGKPHQSLGIDPGDKRWPHDYTDEELAAIAFGAPPGTSPLLNGKESDEIH